MSNKENISKLFAPDSMAIVGASNDLDKPGGRMMNYCNKHGFPGAGDGWGRTWDFSSWSTPIPLGIHWVPIGI